MISHVLRCLPPFKIRAKNKELAPDLDYTDALFLNDSAEMPHGKAREPSSVRYVQERPLDGTSFGRLHEVLLVWRTHVHLGFHY